MVDDSVLLELVAQWEAAAEKGLPISPEQLCGEHPEYLPRLREAIVKLHGPIGTTVTRQNTNYTVALPSSSDPLPPGSGRTSQLYQVGQSVSGFVLLKEVGLGGFGQVFASEDAQLGRKVAIKFLHAKVLERPGSRELFLNEARALAALSNDHVVPIFQIGQDGDNLFLVMPLLAGETLQAKLERDGILPLNEFLRIARELALGLSAIHAKGLIHRDLKPANVWLEAGTGRVKILDLGLADAVANLKTGASAGTPAYMSPEQINAEPLDFRSDLFSLGAIYYECLTARRAFPGKSISSTIDAVLSNSPLPLEQANPATPGEIRQLVTALLQKDRKQRPVSALAVLEAIPPAGDASTRSAVFPQPVQSSNRWPWIIGAVAVMLVVFFVGFALSKWPKSLVSLATTTPPTEQPPLAKLKIESLEVTPIELLPDGTGKDLAPLSQAIRPPVTTQHAIDVKAKLSRPGYCYILLYCSTGQSQLLYPYRDDEIPPLDSQASYPPPKKDVAYQLNDGAGVWAVSLIASESPLPSYRDWQASHPPAPWTKQMDPSMISGVVIDDGIDWNTPNRGGGLSRGSRGEISIARRVPIKPLLDFWQESAKSTVKVIAFPVLAK